MIFKISYFFKNKFSKLCSWESHGETFYVNDGSSQKSSDIYPTFSSDILYICKYIIYL